jgi:hypothetical protein
LNFNPRARTGDIAGRAAVRQASESSASE